MTEEAQRIAIAEACGFTTEQQMDEPETWRIHPQIGTRHFYDSELEAWMAVPDYLNDLNAMHEAEKTLTPEHRKGDAYAARIADVTGCDDMLFAFIHATAAQRAEAFLRAKGLWVD